MAAPRWGGGMLVLLGKGRLPSDLFFFESETEDGGGGGRGGGRSLCISKSQLIFPVREQ